MALIQKPEKTTLGHLFNIKDLNRKVYDPEEIENFRMDEAINEHPLSHRPTNIRSKIAYSEILKILKPTKKYLLPGQLCIFHYSNPKYKEELEYYDSTPLTLFCGITRTDDDVIREIGINLHYYPPFTRLRIINKIYEHFKPWFNKNFNDITGKPNTWISYSEIKHIMNTNTKIGFGVKMYIPVLRGASYVLPTRLVPTACFTEGHFSKATLQQIYHFWRKF